MIDNFSKMEHADVEDILDQCFLQQYDWTLDCDCDDDTWTSVFSVEESRKPVLKEWLSKCTQMQMTAACCIGNAYHSLNMAYVIARLMENYTGNKLNQEFKKLAHLIVENSSYGLEKSIICDFKTFELYYGIHLEENGPIINDHIESTSETDEFVGKTVSQETLVGRNYYLFENGVRLKEQPLSLDISDFDPDFWDDEDNDDDEYDEDEDYEEEDYNELLL